MRGKELPRITFQTRYGQYEFLVMCFWFPNPRKVFLDLMNRGLRDYLDSFVIVFIDDILIYSKNENKYESNLWLALQVFNEHVKTLRMYMICNA